MSARCVEVRLRTELAASPAEVWRHASSMDGVNAELRPWVRMTHPRGIADLASVEVRPGRVLFHSWLLAFGIVPFDRHALGLDEVRVGGDDGAGGAFVEESSSWLQERWRHERTVEPCRGGAVVCDRLLVEPRVPMAVPLVERIVPALFAHRHRRLVRRFGELGPVDLRSADRAPGPAPTQRHDDSEGDR